MYKRTGKIGIWIAIAVFLLAACAIPQISMPTPDLNLVRTEAVVTAVAQMTKQAALNPAPVKASPTSTSQPSATSTPFVVTATTSIYSDGGTGTGGTGGGGSISVTPIPTWTPIVYGAVFVTQNYLDGYVCPTGEQPDFSITFQNIGKATWTTTHYYIKRLYNSPDVKLTGYDQYPLAADVLPGAKATFMLDIVCPTYPGGPWTTQWGLINDNGDVFAKFYFRFFTGLQPTHTPVKTHTPSPG